MSELLIEIYSEEMPAKLQPRAIVDFRNLFIELLNRQNIAYQEEKIRCFISPKRLVLLVEDLDQEQFTPAIKKVGPRTDSPIFALEGFLKSVGVPTVSGLDKINRPNGEYYFYAQKELRIKTIDILEKNLPILLQKMSSLWQKSMRWNLESGLVNRTNWIRPIRNILALFAGEVINFEFSGLKSNNLSFGRHFLDSGSFAVRSFQEHQKKLEENCVILDSAIREKIIIDQVASICNQISCSTIDNLEEKNPLLTEVVHLVDFPVVMLGKIDNKFMLLPPEVLILTIRNHQKYFCLKNHDGSLAPYFVFVANIPINETNRDRIIADNEKVLRARLNDAKFFIDEDLKVPFSSRLEDLKKIIFHEKLGSFYDKVRRLQVLNKFISIWIPHCDITVAEKLAGLAKNDLSTKTVAELPELQGVIGKYYSRFNGEDEEIYNAISEQYLPTGLHSEIAATPLGILMSISDKIDSICGMFLIKEKPTGSKDPFALRRSAIGIIRTINHHHLSLSLKIIVEKSLNSFSSKTFKKIYPEENNREIKLIKERLVQEITIFFLERLKFWLKESQTYLIRQDVINEIFNQLQTNIASDKKCDLYEVIRKSVFISKFVSRTYNSKIIELYKRVANIVAIEEKKDQRTYDDSPYFIALKTKYDKLLYKRVKQIQPKLEKILKNNDYEQAFVLLLELELPLNQFFENVIINSEDRLVRTNRLLILGKIRNLFNSVFDLSKVEI